MKKIGLIFLSVLLISVLVAVGCAGPTPTAAPDKIVIGAIVSLTGYDAQTGQPSKDGYQLGVDMVNAGGGVMVKEYGKKIPLELVVLDMESDPEKAVSRAEALNSQYKASVAVGTTTVFAASDIFEKNKMPAVTMLMNIAGIYQRGFKYYFGMGKINSDTSKAFFDLFDSLKDQRPTKYAFIQEQAEWTNEFFGMAAEEAKARGLTVVSQGKYAMMTPDMSPLIREAKDKSAEVILSLPIPPDGITMLKQMKEMDYNPKAIIMMRAMDDPSWPTLGDIADYTIGSADWHYAINYPGVKELNDKVKATTGENAAFGVGPAYATIQVIADAIERAGTLDRTKIRDAIAATDLMTVIGPVKFNPNGSRMNPTPTVTQLQKGSIELIWPDDLKTKPMVYPRPAPAATAAKPPATKSSAEPVPAGTAIDWSEAKNHMGENVIVTGEIAAVMTFAPPGVVLFMGGPMGVGMGIEISDAASWPYDTDSYKGKTISVAGKIQANPFDGGPQIIVTDPAQVAVR
jgi:branched-chain amino acid transport system substrate-binding protein